MTGRAKRRKAREAAQSHAPTPPTEPPSVSAPPPLPGRSSDPARPLQINERDLVAMALWTRAEAARAFGQTAYHGLRDYYEVFGYKETLEFSDYWQAYKRGGIAKRIIALPAKDTWRKPPTISENGNRDTEFVRAWDKLAARLRVWSMLTRADRLSGIGEFGVILLGFAETKKFSDPVTGKDNALVYLRTFSQGSVEIKKKETDQSNPRFGMPIEYAINFDGNTKGAQLVHWTRIIHLADGKDESEIYGTPRLEAVANLVLGDLVKEVGGAAETFWLNARRSPVVTTQPGYTGLDDADPDELKQQREEIEEYVHGLARFIYGPGLDIKEVGGAAVDPKGAHDVTMDQTAATIDMPKRKLLGSAAGEVASAREDTRQWYATMDGRRNGYAEGEVLRPFIDRLVEFGALPAPGSGGYNVGTLNEDGEWEWPSLFELTEVEQSKIAQNRAAATNSLRDPITGRVPATEQEQRQMLGLTPVPRDEVAAQEVRAMMVANSLSRYESGIRSAVRGLWSGASDEFDFAGAMGVTIRNGLARAWDEGARAAGVMEVERTEEEETTLNLMMANQIGYVDGFADHIFENSKKAGGKLSALNPRIAAWVRGYTEVKNKAMQMARGNPKLQWNLGATEEHCNDCLTYAGRVYRASTWEKHGIRPQMSELGCRGFGDCFFTETDAPANRGFPPKPTGVR